MKFPGVSKQKIEEKLLIESYKGFYFMIICDFFASLSFAALLLNHINNKSLLIGWFLLMLIFNHSLRSIFLYNYYRQKEKYTPRNHQFWKKYFVLSNLQSGLLWGLGGLLFLSVDEPFYRMAIFVYLVGLLGAPSAKLLTTHWACLCFMTPILLVTLFLSLSISPSFSTVLFLATIVYVSVVIYGTFTLNQFLMKSIYLELYSSNILSDLKRSEENFRNTIENAPIGMAIVSPEGNCMHANRTLQDILGYNNEELHNKNILEITHGEDKALSKDSLKKLITGELRVSHSETRYIRNDGSIIWAMVSMSLIRDELGHPLNLILQMRDVSDRIENEEQMRKLNEQTMATLNELKLLEHDENLLNKLNRTLQLCVTVEEAFPRINLIAQELFPDLIGGVSVFNRSINQLETVILWGEKKLLPAVFLAADCFAIREADTIVVDDPQKEVPCGHYLIKPQGGYMTLPLIMQNELIGVIHILNSKEKKLSHHQQDMATAFANIVKLALANINLRTTLSELSIHDPLTNLYNRRYLNDILSRELIRIGREKNTLCVAIIDIDNFKKFNDTYSHLAGDEVLKLIALLLKTSFRRTDINIRFGGEEFVVLLLNLSLKSAVIKMELFREKVKNTPIYYRDKQLPSVTISIGISEAPQHGTTIEEILKSADHALYAAKNSGKDKVNVFH